MAQCGKGPQYRSMRFLVVSVPGQRGDERWRRICSSNKSRLESGTRLGKVVSEDDALPCVGVL